MPELERDGQVIAYDFTPDGGAGVITLINGHTRTMRDFKQMTRYLQDSGYGVLRLDNRGSGGSVATAPFSLDTMAADVRALWDELGITVSRVLGISMGGWIAQLLAAAGPDRVSHLLLVSTTCRSALAVGAETPWGNSPEAVRSKLERYFTPGFTEKNRLLVDAMVREISRKVADGIFIPQADMQRQAMADRDDRAQLPQIRCPVLIVHGEEDRIIPPAAAEELHRLLDGSRLQLVPACGHLLLAEYSAGLRDIILREWPG